jgi:hypothetical protein
MDLRQVQDQTEQEILKTNRLIKNEVLEMADMIEKLATAVKTQDSKLNIIITHLCPKVDINNSMKSSEISKNSSIASNGDYSFDGPADIHQ